MCGDQEARYWMKPIPCGIDGVGAYVPDKIMTNQDLERLVETSDEWIRTRTGISERRIIGAGVNPSDLGVEAARRALADGGLAPADIDAIIVATSSPDMIFPSTACVIQGKMGLDGVPAFDVNAACAGFVFGLSVASQYVGTGEFGRILFIGADALSRHVNWDDRGTCILFGDGAGAVVLGPAEEGFGVLASCLAASGAGADLLKIPAGAASLPGTKESVEEKAHCIQMNGAEVFKFAVRAIPEVTEKALGKAGLTPQDVTYLIPHQANIRIIKTAAQRLGLSMEKVVVNIDRYGNTSTASIPLALDEICRAGRLRRGDVLVFVGVGAGFTWGANVVRWHKDRRETS